MATQTITDIKGNEIEVEFEGAVMYVKVTGGCFRLDALETYHSAKLGQQVYQTKNLKIQMDAATYQILVATREANRQPVATTPITTPVAKPVTSGPVAAKFAGTCKRSGRRYAKGAMIEQTAYGWALIGTQLNLSYQMDRADSIF
ncbi:MAG: hypothetical protein ACR2OE_02910 [Thermomicrobiales bacterium]